MLLKQDITVDSLSKDCPGFNSLSLIIKEFDVFKFKRK